MIENSSTTKDGVPPLKNPYVECFADVASTMRPHHPLWFVRRALGEVYSLAVPTTRTIHQIAEVVPKYALVYFFIYVWR